MGRPENRVAVERMLALSRLALSAACLVPLWTGAFDVSGFRQPLLPLILGYIAYGAAVLAAVALRQLPADVAQAARAGDLVWAATLGTVSRGALAPMLAAVVLLVVMAEVEVRRSVEAGVTTELLAGLQAQRGFRLAMRYVASELMRLTGSDEFLVAARALDSDRAVLWTATRPRGDSLLLVWNDLPRDRQRLYFFEVAGEAWAIVRQRHGRCTLTAADRDGHLIEDTPCDFDAAFWQYHQHRAAVAVSVAFDGAWRGRLFLLRDRPYSANELRFVQRLVRQLVPALHTHYLGRRLRSHAATAARRAVLPYDIAREPIVPALSDIVSRFGRDHGIRARFYAGPQDA